MKFCLSVECWELANDSVTSSAALVYVKLLKIDKFLDGYSRKVPSQVILGKVFDSVAQEKFQCEHFSMFGCK